MSKRGFFSFALGTAAVAAGISLVKKKGGLHVSFDVKPSGLGDTPSEWRAKHDGAETASEPEGNGEAETEEN